MGMTYDEQIASMLGEDLGKSGGNNFFQKAGDFLSGDAGKALAAGIGGLFGLAGGGGDTQGSQGYTGGIPEYTAKREQVPGAFDPTGRRPGEAGRRYFTDTQYIPKTDAAGIQTVMGGDYLAQLNADALARQKKQQSDLDNFIQFLVASQMAGQAPTVPGTTDPTEPYFDPATGNKIVSRAEGLPDLALTPYRQDFEPPQTISGGVIPGSGADMYEPAYNTLNELLAGKNTLPEQIEIFDRFGISDTTAAKYLGITPSDLVTARENIENKRIADESRAEKTATDTFNAKYPEAGAGVKPALSPWTGKVQYNEDGAWLGNDRKYYRGNPPGFAQGGIASLGGQGYYLGGTTDGMADNVPATIDGREPARLSDGEFVIPADVVSHLGNGNSDAGARNLYSMMDRVRKARTGTTRQGRQINPQKYLA
jgi:hypothetical protein